ncbi:MAG: hypothetical protein WCD35_08890 [Mycobacteriales bacterium]
MRKHVVLTREPDLGPAFDEAVERLADLARRIGNVRAVHRPVRGRLTWIRPRCAGCGREHPCPTLRAMGEEVTRRA